MKSKNLPLASLLIIGILGASGSTAAAIEINDIQLHDIQRNSIGIIPDQLAINGTIRDIQAAALDEEISNTQIIAIAA